MTREVRWRASPLFGPESKNRRWRPSALFFLLFWASAGHAAFIVGPGETGSEFLKIPTAARGVALGTSFTAMNADVTALDYNPAGIAGNDRIDINLTHNVYLEGTRLNSVAFSYPFNFISVNRPNSLRAISDGRMVAAAQYRLFQADDEERNDVGAPQGSFRIREEFAHVALAYLLQRNLSIGASAKYIRERILTHRLNNYAFDAGVQYRPVPFLSLGMALLNMGPDKAFITDPEPLPTTVRVGAAYHFKQWLWLLDFAQGRDKISQKSTGIEFQASPLVSIRGGLLHHTSLEFSGGIGIRFSDVMGTRPSGPRGASDNTAPQRYRLGEPESASSPGMRKEMPLTSRNAPSLDFGLDYAVQTNGDLGLTHAVSVKFLY